MSDFRYWLRWVRNERRRLAKVARYRRATGLRPFRLSELRNKRRSDTLFILGSGASINRLDDADWDTIARHDSIGLNFWMLHRFVPDFYMFEAGPTGERTRDFERFLSERADRYRDVPLIYKDTDRHQLNLAALPDQIVANMRVLNKINLPIDEERFLRRALTWALRLRVPRITDLQLFARVSIVQAISIGAAMGYKEIILAGVDLNNIRYFWQDDPELSWFGVAQSGTVHKTMVKDQFLPVDRIIDTVEDVWLKPAGIRLYCGHATSALHPQLPAYFT